ncbi:hypothetical protein L1F28_32185 [Arthrospira platensis NCB002]|uniref:Secreted protein n=1 Tax=Limnospira platensis NIES-46 TaxID=1236695 RepID=A0A5M3T460_LIMPL|nr:hypothetical protein [Arthrospira platensis]MDF2213248.1 hypothetical protein [Arthrospira platensis NCB002]BAI91601.1 hypothetical protein NIES39_J05550 [Arthrospira platensis NIES-39]BDT13895.1 hypothetical protein N39L_36180 [Arthrospira platensis NIES-39]GCE92768.1 hypothetical protein NIES46_08090 [Arthrospira platensis NIES-46]
MGGVAVLGMLRLVGGVSERESDRFSGQVKKAVISPPPCRQLLETLCSFRLNLSFKNSPEPRKRGGVARAATGKTSTSPAPAPRVYCSTATF